jgi:ParB/Sulfiredoxin domain
MLLDPTRIFIPEGNRPVDGAKVRALKVSIEQRGLLQPIGVRAGRPDSADKTAYTLVFGRHRLLAWLGLLEDAVKTGDRHRIGRFTSIPGIAYDPDMPDELLQETALIENVTRLGRSAREQTYANWTMIAMMKGRGASFDPKTQPQAEWVVRLITRGRKTQEEQEMLLSQMGQ